MSRDFRLPLSLLSGLVGVHAAHAQTAGEAEKVLQGEPLIVQERLLTESPATVSRVELATLPSFQLSTGDVAARAANFFVANNGARSFNDVFALRGLTNTPIFGDPAVSVYLDDLPLGSGFTFPTVLAGFARAELHRGPSQNTVFGRAGSAGVLRFRTPASGPAPTGEVRASFGNHGARAVSAQASSSNRGPVDAQVSATWAERDGYLRNTTLGRDVDFQDARSALARFRYRPADTAEFTLLLSGLRARDGVQPLVPLGGPLRTVSRSAEGVTEVDAFNAALTAKIDTPVGQLSATTGFSDWQLDPYANTLDFGFAELANQVAQQQRTWSEELKLASDRRERMHWQVGAFFADAETKGTFLRAFGPFVYEHSHYQIDARSLAGYGEATAELTSALSVTGGLRLEDSRKELDRRGIVPGPTTLSRTGESTALLPKLAARYRFTPESSVFASVGAGYKPGGFSAFTGNPALVPFGPERTQAIEAGLTQTAAHRALSSTLRFFWYDITGYQIERSFVTGGQTDDYLVVNAPRARSYGGEFELSWRPLPGLTITADVGVTDVTLRDFRDPYSGATFDGRRPPSVPTHDLALQANYEHRSGFFAGAELTAVGRTYYTEGEDLLFAQRSYTLLGAQLGYASDRYRVTLFGANLTEEDYYSAITPGTGHGTPGAPRTYGVQASLRF